MNPSREYATLREEEKTPNAEHNQLQSMKTEKDIKVVKSRMKPIDVPYSKKCQNTNTRAS